MKQKINQKIITKQDYLNYKTSCKYTFFKSSEELKKIFTTNNVTDDDFFDISVPVLNDNELNDDGDVNIYEGNLIGQKFKEFIQKKYPGFKIIDLSEYDRNVSAQLTKQKIASNNKCIIFEACFFDKKNNAVCRNDALIKFSSDNYQIIECKGSKNLKSIYYYDILYQYYLTKINNIAINNLFLAVITDEKQKQNDSVVKLFKFKNQFELKNKNNDNNITILDAIKQSLYPQKSIPTKNRVLKNIFKQNKDIEKKYSEEDFWNDIEDLKNYDKDNNNNFEYIQSQCKGPIMDCKYYKKSCENKYLINNYPLLKYSKDIFPTKNKLIFEKRNCKLSDFKDKIDKNYYFLVEDPEISCKSQNHFVNFLNNFEKKQIVWFDFETINTLVCCLDYSTAGQNIPFQCSLIFTDENFKIEKDKCKNILFDPKNINLSLLKMMVDNIFVENVIYIAYHKTFEITVLKGIRKIFEEIHGTKFNNEIKKINKIIENTFDLENLFAISSTKHEYLKIKSLNGFSSIKKVNDYIEKECPQIFQKYKIDNYKNLEFKNGLEVNEFAKKRFFNLISDSEWRNRENDLKQYCENDVKNMLAIYDYGQMIKFKIKNDSKI